MARLAIRMPKMSMTMTEGEVSSWQVKVGDTIAEGDVVAEVMTDKVDMEVESPVAGTLVEIVHESGSVEVGEPIGWVEGEGDGGFGDLLAQPDPAPETVVERVQEADSEAKAPTAPPGPPTSSGPPAAVPRARGLANEHGINLTRVTGTGPEGLIRVSDVEAIVRSSISRAPTALASRGPVAAPAAAAQVKSDRKAAIRAAVARKMTPSAEIPQFTVWREIHLDAANAGRRGLSWTTVLLRAYAAALRDVPELLCRWEDDRATDSGPPEIALAVATDRGLLVPTFEEPDLANPNELDTAMREVVRAAHSGKLDRRYMGVANGSLSNLGGMGVDRFQALLTPPQASVLALGVIKQRPVAVPGGVGLALTVHAGLTVDHRVADGAQAAQLLQCFAARLGATV